VTAEEIHDNPTGWINKHIRSYVATDGATGQRYDGKDSLLITTRGRKSGKLRRTALYYGVDANRYVVIASYGGRPVHPGWYLNLVAEPELAVQIGAEVFRCRARTAEGEEEARLWDLMAGIFPLYNKYRAGTDRHIPVVVLERAATS
jgi:deazaflavin-dependent oxidoreductase (nitroreductase family)